MPGFKNLRCVIFLLPLFLCISAKTYAASPINKLQPAVAQSIDTKARSFASSGCSGVSVGVAYGNDVVYTRTYGSHDISNTRQWASVSKSATAVITMQLVAEGKLSLDTPVKQYNPASKNILPSNLTLRHLLTHRGCVNHLGSLQFSGTPACSSSYSTNGYRIIGEVLEAVENKTYASLVESRLGTAAAAATMTANDSPIAPGAYVSSTIEDFAKYAKSFLNNVYLSSSAKQTMMSNQASGYGFGLRSGSYNGHPIAYHSGSNGSNKAYIYYYPDKKIGVTLFCSATEQFGSTQYLKGLAEPVAALLASANPCANPADCSVSVEPSLTPGTEIPAPTDKPGSDEIPDASQEQTEIFEPASIPFMGVKLGELKEPLQGLDFWLDVILKIFLPPPTPTPTPEPTTLISTPTPTGAAGGLTPSPTPAVSASSCETRGVWLNDGAFNDAHRAQTVSDILKANINTIFIASHPLKGNFGWSTEADFKAFLADLDGANTTNKPMSLHVWLSSMDRTGNRGSLDYTQTAEQNAHRSWCADWITAYPELDGIQLDNVRYDGGQMDDAKRKGIADTMKACDDGMKAAGGAKKKFLTSFVDNIDPVAQKATDTSSWFNTWLSANPSNPLKIGGTQYYPSNLKVDPINWVKGGYFDALMPGDYTSSPELWARRIPIWKSLLGSDFDKLVFGVAWMDNKADIVWPGPDGQSYSGGGAVAANVVTQIKAAQALGMKGFSIFQFGKPLAGVTDTQLANVLTQGTNAPFYEQASSCISADTSVAAANILTAAGNVPPLPVPTVPAGTMLAFPGAEGYGAFAKGGRGGRVIEVTNLNDDGPGSLREAVAANGPRTVVFRTQGAIHLTANINITEPFLTIAGQTAPGSGITLVDRGLNIATHDVVVRYIKIRPGLKYANQSTSVGGLMFIGSTQRPSNSIVDHCSVTWSPDKNVYIWDLKDTVDLGARDITVQHCLIAEGLDELPPIPTNGAGKVNVLIGQHNHRVSLRKNVMAHSNLRNPYAKADTSGEIVNNIIYNWADRGSHLQDSSDTPPDPIIFNIVGNYYKPGPATTGVTDRALYIDTSNPSSKFFLKNNSNPKRQSDNASEWSAVEPGSQPSFLSAFAPVLGGMGFGEIIPVVPGNLMTFVNEILDNVGANYPLRDTVDDRIIRDVRNGTGKLILDPDLVGGYPTVIPGTPAVDTDHDGMGDEWEQQQFGNLSQGSAADSGSDKDGDGYTDLEEYLNNTNPAVGGS